MNVHQLLFFCFLSALCGGDTLKTIFQCDEGGLLSAFFHFDFYESWKFCCRSECEEGDVVIETEENRTQSGRYSIEYKEEPLQGRAVLYLEIKQLSKSDSGLYRCGFGKHLVSDLFMDFEIKVFDAPQDGLVGKQTSIYLEREGNDFRTSSSFASAGNTKFFCRNQCRANDLLIRTTGDMAESGRYSITWEPSEGDVGVLHVDISQLTMFDSGSYWFGEEGTLTPGHRFEIRVAQDQIYTYFNIETSNFTAVPETTVPSMVSSPVSHPVFLLLLVVCLLVVAVLLAVVLLLLYVLRANRNSDSRDKECVAYENHPRVSNYEDSIYQSLDPASRDQGQIYSTAHT